MAVGDVFKKRRKLTQQSAAPRSFNPQNQGVLARASAVLDAVKQDRLNPMYGGAQSYAAPGANGQRVGGTSPIPGIVGRGLDAASQGLNFAQDGMESYQRGRNSLPPVPPGQQVGYAAPGQNTAIQGSPGLRGFVNSVGSGLASAYNSVASALTAPQQRYNGPMENLRPERISDLQDTPGFRFSWNGAGSGDVPNLADALNDPQPSNPIRGGYTPEDRGPIPRSVASQSPNYYQQQAAGMDVESVRRRDLAGQIDALRQRSQRDNPMAPPAPAYDPMQAEIDRGTRQQNIMFEPGATSSGGASKNFHKIPTEDLNSTTAGTVNGYNGNLGYAQNPMRLDPETKLNLAEGNARRIVGGGAAADPTNIGGRFGGAYGTGLNADATAIAEGRAVRTADGKVVYHTGTQESARRAQTAGKVEREALRNRNNMNVPQAELDRRDAADAQKAARAAKHQAFKDANGGMSYRQYDRMQNSNALTMKAVDEGRLSPEAAMFRMQTRADKALRRAGNPMAMSTANGGRLFPDLLAGRGGQQAPAAPRTNPIFGPGAPNTVENIDARATARQANVQSSPTLTAWGVSPDLDPSGFAQTVGQNLFTRQPDGGFGFAEVSDDGIKSIFNQVKLFDPTGDGKPPFPEGSIYNQMWGMPEDTPPAELRKMFEAMLANMNSVPQAPMGQAGQGSWASQGKM